jgi:hypothetical protein
LPWRRGLCLIGLGGFLTSRRFLWRIGLIADYMAAAFKGLALA